jgi:hypothetical protein
LGKDGGREGGREGEMGELTNNKRYGGEHVAFLLDKDRGRASRREGREGKREGRREGGINVPSPTPPPSDTQPSTP